jgi:hypothetical protein
MYVNLACLTVHRYYFSIMVSVRFHLYILSPVTCMFNAHRVPSPCQVDIYSM